MISFTPKVLIIAAGLIAAALTSGCDEKAPEIPPPEPTAVSVALSATPIHLQSSTTVVPAG